MNIYINVYVYMYIHTYIHIYTYSYIPHFSHRVRKLLCGLLGHGNLQRERLSRFLKPGQSGLACRKLDRTSHLAGMLMLIGLFCHMSYVTSSYVICHIILCHMSHHLEGMLMLIGLFCRASSGAPPRSPLLPIVREHIL